MTGIVNRGTAAAIGVLLAAQAWCAEAPAAGEPVVRASLLGIGALEAHLDRLGVLGECQPHVGLLKGMAASFVGNYEGIDKGRRILLGIYAPQPAQPEPGLLLFVPVSDADTALRSLTMFATKGPPGPGSVSSFQLPKSEAPFYARPVGTYLGFATRPDLLTGLESTPPSLQKGEHDTLDLLADIDFDQLFALMPYTREQVATGMAEQIRRNTAQQEGGQNEFALALAESIAVMFADGITAAERARVGASLTEEGVKAAFALMFKPASPMAELLNKQAAIRMEPIVREGAIQMTMALASTKTTKSFFTMAVESIRKHMPADEARKKIAGYGIAFLEKMMAQEVLGAGVTLEVLPQGKVNIAVEVPTGGDPEMFNILSSLFRVGIEQRSPERGWKPEIDLRQEDRIFTARMKRSAEADLSPADAQMGLLMDEEGVLTIQFRDTGTTIALGVGSTAPRLLARPRDSVSDEAPAGRILEFKFSLGKLASFPPFQRGMQANPVFLQLLEESMKKFPDQDALRAAAAARTNGLQLSVLLEKGILAYVMQCFKFGMERGMSGGQRPL